MRKFKATLNTKSIDNLIKELTEYKNSLPEKTRLLTEKLLEKGIVRAEIEKGIGGTFGTHHMEDYVTFEKRVDVTRYGCYGVLLGMGAVIESEWYGLDGEKRNGSISSILALEFGTAALAVPPTSKFGGSGGQGTNSQYGHANEFEWYFITGFKSDGKPIYKYATAIAPSRPMLKASEEMMNEIKKTAKEVFSA